MYNLLLLYFIFFAKISLFEAKILSYREIDKYRTWITDLDPNFRPMAKSASPIPKYGRLVLAPRLAMFSLVRMKNDFIVFGGMMQSKENENEPLAKGDASDNVSLFYKGYYSEHTLRFDIERNEWYDELPWTKVPAARIDHDAWKWDDLMYIYGGANDTVMNDVWNYRNRTWKLMNWPNVPARRGHSASVLKDSDLVYVFGGSDKNDEVTNSFFTINRTSGEVKDVTFNGELPPRRMYHAASVMITEYDGVLLFIHGGTDGKEVFRDLWVFYKINNTWRFLNDGTSPQVYAWDSAIIPPLKGHPAMKHSCGAIFPLLYCIGGHPSGDPISMIYDIKLERWVRAYYTNPERLAPLEGNRVILFINHLNETEIISVGGTTGRPAFFLQSIENITMFKTNFFPPSCPWQQVNGDWEGRCFSCKPGQGANKKKDPHRCYSCASGFYAQFSQCYPCPKGTYNSLNGTSNVTSCIKCPPGYFTYDEGSTNASQCITCKAGTYAFERGCASCPPGTYGNVEGAPFMDIGCIPCPFGSFSVDYGQTSCVTCPAGTSSGRFIANLDPYALYIINLVESSKFTGCPKNVRDTFVNPLNAENPFYMTIGIRDVGVHNGFTNAYYPLSNFFTQSASTWAIGSRAWQAPNRPWHTHIANDVKVFLEYDGPAAKIHYNCKSDLLEPTDCQDFIMQNQTSNEYTLVGTPIDFETGECAKDYGVKSFFFRIADEGIARIRIMAQGTKGVSLNLKVVQMASLRIMPLPYHTFLSDHLYSNKTITILAWSRGNIKKWMQNFTGDTKTVLRAECQTGNPLLFRFSSSENFSNEQNIVFKTPGIFTSSIEFKNSAKACKFIGVNHKKEKILGDDTKTFEVQQLDRFNVTISGNASNFGIIHVDYFLFTTTGEIATADNFTEINVLVEKAYMPKQHSIYMYEYPFSAKAFQGVAKAFFHVFTKAPVLNISTWSHIIGKASNGQLINRVEKSQKFWIIKANGTHLRLITDTYKMPRFVTSNKTFILEIELQDKNGVHVGRRDPIVDVTISGCSATIRMVNISKHGPNRFKMGDGHALVYLFIQGYDTKGCILRFHEVSSPPSKVRDLYTPAFDVISPKRLFQDFVCSPVVSGDIIIVNVSVLSSTDQVVKLADFPILMESTGNSSSAFEVDGKKIREVVEGVTQFKISYLASQVPVKVVFWPGEWVTVPVYNYTYITHPYFKRIAVFLYNERVFRKISYINIAFICPLIPKISATSIKIISRTPRWIEADKPIKIEYEAVNIFGIRDIHFNESVSLRVKNCNYGSHRDINWWILEQNNSKNPTPLIDYDDNYRANVYSLAKFSKGYANIVLLASYFKDAEISEGVKGCSVVISISDTGKQIEPAFFEGYEVRHVFTGCQVCPPGTWSQGGDGRNPVVSPSIVFHAGGCIPCMIGTFSSESGATSENSCETCLSGYGYPSQSRHRRELIQYEGSIACLYKCSIEGSSGRIGGGPCPRITSLTAPNANVYGSFGRTHRLCSETECPSSKACNKGQFNLMCNLIYSMEECYNPAFKSNCIWNGSHCLGPVGKCMPCPPGTSNYWEVRTDNVNNLRSCNLCYPGGWSTSEGLRGSLPKDIYTYSRFYCHRKTAMMGHDICTRLILCPDGTYSKTYGATTSTVCKPCPKGHYCHPINIHRIDYVGTQCFATNCDPKSHDRNYACPKETYIRGCPYNKCQIKVSQLGGVVNPFPCPEGTFLNEVGAKNPKECLKCLAGTYCPRGTVEPIKTDIYNTDLNLTGKQTPYAVSFAQSADFVICASRWTSDGSGYILDGHFNDIARYFKNNINGQILPISGYTNKWSGSYDFIDADCKGDPSSMSTKTNSSSGSIWQSMSLLHELPIDMVVRVWVLDKLDRRDPAGIFPLPHPSYAGIELIVNYVDDLSIALPGDSQTFTRELKPYWDVNNPKQKDSWHLFEMNIYPKRAIRSAKLSFSTHGFYDGHMLFDDISFRPGHNRICNCSTGFYYNMSMPPARRCMRCLPGFACSGGTISQCVGSWSTSAMAGCQYCRKGWLCDSDCRGRLIPCNLYTYKDNKTQVCLPCPIGYSCKDGIKYQCDDGYYGNGGIECLPCSPGYYSPKGSPQGQCLRCPPGTSSLVGRPSCFSCPINTYSPDGKCCLSAPVGTFVPSNGSTAPIPCTNPVMDSYSFSIPRNKHGFVIRVVPYICELHNSYMVTRTVDVSNGFLGKVKISKQAPAVIYDAGSHNYPADTHVFRVYFTANINLPEQYSTVTIKFTNTASIGAKSTIWISHPERPITFRITGFSARFYNKENDWIFIQSVTAPLADPSISAPMPDPPGPPRLAQVDMGINPDSAVGVDYTHNHPAIFVNLPKGFRGPMTIRPITFDQKCATPSNDCLETSPHALITIISRTNAPTANNDFFRVQMGKVVPLDVLKNDFDVDNDFIKIVSTSYSTRSKLQPYIQSLCIRNSDSCTGCTTDKLYKPCSCSYNRYQDRCVSDNEKNQSQYFLDYVAKTGVCGQETFKYTIDTQDGQSTATVTVDNYLCYCFGDSSGGHPTGFNIIFLLDGTTSIDAFNAQLIFADSIMRRSSESQLFYYGIIEVGANKIFADLDKKYFSIYDKKRDPYGDTYEYRLGAALNLTETMIQKASNIPTFVLIISTKESYDDVSEVDKILPSVHNFLTISINPEMKSFKHFIYYFRNLKFSKVIKDESKLNHKAELATEAMDLMCRV